MAPGQGPHGTQGTHKLERPPDRRLRNKLSRALTSAGTSPCLFPLFLSPLGSLNSHFSFKRGRAGLRKKKAKGRGSALSWGHGLRDGLWK